MLIILVVALVDVVSAQDSTWTGLGAVMGYGLDANNWSPVGVPPSGNSSSPVIGNVTLAAANGWLSMTTILPGQIETPRGWEIQWRNITLSMVRNGGQRWMFMERCIGIITWPRCRTTPLIHRWLIFTVGGVMSGQGLALSATHGGIGAALIM